MLLRKSTKIMKKSDFATLNNIFYTSLKSNMDATAILVIIRLIKKKLYDLTLEGMKLHIWIRFLNIWWLFLLWSISVYLCWKYSSSPGLALFTLFGGLKGVNVKIRLNTWIPCEKIGRLEVSHLTINLKIIKSKFYPF